MGRRELDMFVMCHPAMMGICTRYGLDFNASEGSQIYQAALEDVKTGILIAEGYLVNYADAETGRIGRSLLVVLQHLCQAGKITQPQFAANFLAHDTPALQQIVREYRATYGKE